MRIFDFHTHIFPDELAERAIAKLASAAPVTPFTNGTLLGTAELMRQDGVDRFLTLHTATNPKQQSHVNAFALSVSASGIAEAFGSVYPKSSDALDEVMRLYQAGFKGIKLHPEYQDFDLCDPSVYPVYALCRDLGLAVIFHAGIDFAYPNSLCAPVAASKKVAAEFKGLTLIAAHFGGFLLADEVLETLAGKSDIYLDTSFSIGYVTLQLAEKIIKKHGAEKILFGSDCPWGSPKAHIEFIDGIKISDREKDLIFYENAKGLLKLK